MTGRAGGGGRRDGKTHKAGLIVIGVAARSDGAGVVDAEDPKVVERTQSRSCLNVAMSACTSLFASATEQHDCVTVDCCGDDCGRAAPNMKPLSSKRVGIRAASTSMDA
jgi:hypothetical protein